MAVKEQATRSFSNDAENHVRECKAIPVRSGTEVQTTMDRNSETKALTKAKKETLGERVEKEPVPFTPGRIMFPDNSQKITTPLPYPQRFKKKNLDEQFSKLLEVFKKLHINIPFADTSEHMPNYVKFLKEMMSKKHKIKEFKTISLSKECSAIVQRKLPKNEKDRGSFTIPCTIGDTTLNNVLCDLGSIINLMPLSIFRKLGLKEAKPTTIALQMADCSIAKPWVVIEDMFVKVDRFIYSVDFVVLDMGDDNEVPLILGRPFLATGRALIDIEAGFLTLRVDNEQVHFHKFHLAK